MSSSRRVGVLAPMPSELRPVARAMQLARGGDGLYRGVVGAFDVVASGTGIGTARARKAAESMLAAGDFEHVFVVGIAGGLGASRVGDVLVPAVVVDRSSGEEFGASPVGDAVLAGRLVTHDALDMSPDEAARLVAGGVVAVDMETAAIASVCARRNVRWTAVRAISDLVGVTPGDVIDLANPDGTPNAKAALRYLVTKPWRIPRLVKLGLDARNAADAAATTAARVLARQGRHPAR